MSHSISFILNMVLINNSQPHMCLKNGVVECKNRTLVEMSRTMLDEHTTPRRFWAEESNTACYISN
jgi:hypothetical protein